MTSPVKSRWRPRFSLGALLIFVLLIGLIWAATAKWGCAAIENKVESDLNASGIFLAPMDQTRGNSGIDSSNYHAHYSAIAPFIVRVDLYNQELNLHAIYFWLPGWKMLITKNFIEGVR